MNLQIQNGSTNSQESEVPVSIVNQVAESIPDDEHLVENISEYVKSLKSVQIDHTDFSRTAEEIVSSGEQRGCHEAGLVFVSLLRAKGKIASYIQAFLKEDLKNFDLIKGGDVGGHVFVRYDGKVIDSTSGEEFDELPEEYILGGEGQDSQAIGIQKDLDDYLKLFLKVKSEL